MTLADFLRHLTNHNCEYSPLTGINVSGYAIRIDNKSNGLFHIMQIYKGGEVSDKQVILVCFKLGIPIPSSINP
jgi:hypothetical protein